MKNASFALALLLAIRVLSHAQTANTGAVAGVISDPNRTVVAGVRVTATNEATGEPRSVLSQANGSYTIALLPPGSYRVEFKKDAFKNAIRTDLAVNVTEVTRLDAELELGTVQQEIYRHGRPATAADGIGGTGTDHWREDGGGPPASCPQFHPDHRIESGSLLGSQQCHRSGARQTEE